MARILIFGLGFLSLMGCGPKFVPIQGKLTAAGKPLAGFQVVLIPADAKGTLVEGLTEWDGSFVVYSRDGSGVIPGEYRVAVRRFAGGRAAAAPADGKPAPDAPTSRESLPAVLGDLTQTPLRTTIPPTGGEVVIDIPNDLLQKQGHTGGGSASR